MSLGEQHFNIKTVKDLPSESKDFNALFENVEEDFNVDEYNGYDTCGSQFMQACDESSETCILLDSQSTHSTFLVRELLTNVRVVSPSLQMITNGGSITYTQQGDLEGYGAVWFNDKAIANIISMSEAERKGHKITYSPGCLKIINVMTKKETAFIVTKEGLYAHRVPINGISMVQTVKENEELFTLRQVGKARKARELYEMIGRPSYRDFVGIIQNNLLLNARITVEDINHAEHIFGKDLGSIVGKTTRAKPQHVVTDQVLIPPDIMIFHRNVILSADIMYIDRVPFLLTISRDIQFTTVERLVDKRTTSLEKGLLKVCGLYKRRGFVVKTCLADLEFESTRGILTKNQVILNTCAPSEHVPEIERRIRTVKERVRAVIISLPFSRIPRPMVIHTVIFSVMWLNFFPPKGGVSTTLSQQAIVTGLAPDAEKHCKMPFGGYAQIHAEPTQTNDVMVSRTVGGISLGPTGNIQGTYKFLSLLTGNVIQARSFTILPMPTEIIKMVESMCARLPTNHG